MTHFEQATDLGVVTTTTIITVISMVVAGWLVSLPLRRRWAEGQALGMLVWMGAADLALYLARWLHLNMALFAAASALFALILVALAQSFIFQQPDRTAKDSLALPVSLALASLFVLVRLMTPFPQSGYSIFQGLYPAYIQHALAQGVFPQASETVLGAGFFARNHLAYPMDSAGFAALVAWLSAASNVHAVYLGSTISPGVSIIILFIHSCRNRFPMAIMAILYLFFIRYGDSLRLPLLDNWVDNLLLFSGGLSLYYMTCVEDRRVSMAATLFAATFMTFSRPYGGFYAGLIGLAFASADLYRLRHKGWKNCLIETRHWFVMAGILLIFFFNELVLMILGGIYHAQPFYAASTPASSEIVLNTVREWGLIADHSHLRLPIPMAVFIFIAIAGLAVTYNRPWRDLAWDRLAPMTAPILLLLGPLIVELITGYRRGFGNFSKLYIGAQYLFVFYPALIVNRGLPGQRLPRLLQHHHHLLPRLAWTGLIVGVIVCMAGVHLYKDKISNKIKQVVSTYTSHNVDYLLGEKLHNDLIPQDQTTLASRRILYLYHEPGLGLRYYIGGDTFNDLDFWGPTVQGLIAKNVSLPELLHSLDYPLIWLSYPGWKTLGTLTGQTQSLPVAEAIHGLDEMSPLVDGIFHVKGAALIVTRPPEPH